jgi:ABC-type antimicrobial peptide transport system permease subunit
VTRRRTELGVRRALGADGRGLVRLVGTRVVREVAVGLGLGLTVGWLMGSSIQALAFQVDPRDPRVFLAVAALVGMVALVATTAPLRRALRADPVEALRAE